MQRQRRRGITLPSEKLQSFLTAIHSEFHPKQDVIESGTQVHADLAEKNVEVITEIELSTSRKPIDSASFGTKTLLTARADTLRMSRRRRESSTSLGPQVGARKNSFHIASRTHNFLQQDTESHLMVVLGSPGVGKTALIVRYITGRFVNEYDPTLEMIYEKLQEVGNVKGLLRIMDTAGSIESCISYIRKAEGIIVVYSITDRYSFDAAKDYLSMIKEYTKLRSPFDYDLPTILVGNKRELRRGREVSRNEARMVAQEYSCSIVDSSAAYDKNVQKLFTNLFLQIHRIKEERQRMISSNTRGFVNSVRNFFHSKRK